MLRRRRYSIEWREYDEKIVYNKDRTSWKSQGFVPSEPPRYRWSRAVLAKDAVEAVAKAIIAEERRTTVVLSDSTTLRVRVEASGEILSVFRAARGGVWQVAWP